MHWQNQVIYHSRTDVGVKRSHNQDALGVVVASNEESWGSRGHLFIVADGMGAHAVGEMASKMAVDTIQITYRKRRDLSPDDAIRQAIVEANQTIYERGQKNREFEGMGTTATALVILPDGARVGHVGDSRCYRIRGPAIEQLSFDHSLQWEMARRQNVEPENLKSVPRNVIVRSLGPEKRVKVDVNGPYGIEEGDKFLLCSDGLSGPVRDKEMWASVSFLPSEEVCPFLVDLANLRGGLDNITVVVVNLGDPDALRGSKGRIGELLRLQTWKNWLTKVPLPAWFLVTGLTMASVGYLLGISGLRGVFIALVALILLCAALGIMVLKRQRSPAKPPAGPPPPPPIYRSSIYCLDRSLIDELAETERRSRDKAIDERWKLDWVEYHQTRQRAEEEVAANELTAAFRSYARLLSLLAAGMRTTRDKQEVFKPNFQPEETP